jgi:hypothetical protein
MQTIVQKILNNPEAYSIQALSRAVQLGIIPPYVGVSLIDSKKQQAKSLQGEQALAQPSPDQQPTVADQVMSQSIDSLPTNLPTEYASGGIVAFQNNPDQPVRADMPGSEEFVQGPTGMHVLRSELDGAQPRRSGSPRSLAEIVNEIRGLNKDVDAIGPETQAYQEALRRGTSMPQDKEQQKNLRIIEAGLGILGARSPFALSNIAEGSMPALRGYGQDIRQQREDERAQQMQRLKELELSSGIERSRATAMRDDVKTAALLQKEEIERNSRELIAKDQQLGVKYAQNYLAMKRQAGDARPDEVILNEGYGQFFKQYGFAQGRSEAQVGTAAGAQSIDAAELEQRRREATQQARTSAAASWDGLSITNPAMREYRRLSKENPAAAEDFKSRWIDNAARDRMPGASAAPRPAPTQSPAPSTQSPGRGQESTAKPNIASIQGAPSGSVIGSFVAGKGWEIKGRNGQLLGYAQ